ncbi:MAG: T9SS type A sorting domain-containing protein [Flavobacteriales bacterium]|nr:T9SS type A sorting domain-containing protein [Flavobacteriales bacterium]
MPLRDNNAAGGTITTGSGQGSWASSGRSYVQHNSTTNTSGSWTFTWNAPSFSDTVVFYASGLAANGANGNANDYTYTTTSTILPIQPITFTTDSVSTTCFEGCDGEASVTVSGGGIAPYSYLWSTNDTTTSISGLCAGTYTVTITDDEGHEEEAEINVDEPTAIQAQFTTLPSSCAFGNGEISVIAIGGAGGYTYQWNDTANTTDSLIQQAGIGWFTVTITDTAGCSVIDSAEILFSSSGLNGIVESNSENCDLGNGSTRIQMIAGNQPYSYSWSSGASSSINQNLASGTHTVTVTDGIGCVETFMIVVEDQVMIVDDSLSIAKPTRCFNGGDGSINITTKNSEGPITYKWSHDTLANSSSYSNLNAGQYLVTISDSAGCALVDTFNVNQPDSVYLQTLIDSANDGFCDGAISATMFGGTPAYTYSWPHDNAITSANALDLCAGTYLITATDDTGCLFLINAEVPVKLGVNTLDPSQSFDIYPNPAVNHLNIVAKSSATYEARITNMAGQVVLSESGMDSKRLDITNFAKGVYQVSIETGKGVTRKTFIVDK